MLSTPLSSSRPPLPVKTGTISKPFVSPDSSISGVNADVSTTGDESLICLNAEKVGSWKDEITACVWMCVNDDCVGDEDGGFDGAGVVGVSVFPQRYAKVGRQAMISVPVTLLSIQSVLNVEIGPEPIASKLVPFEAVDFSEHDREDGIRITAVVGALFQNNCAKDPARRCRGCGPNEPWCASPSRDVHHKFLIFFSIFLNVFQKT